MPEKSARHPVMELGADMKRLAVSSPEFTDGGTIPEAFTCDGDDASPPLEVRNVPQEARSVAIVVDDPDAPGGTFVHWTAWNLPPDNETIPRAADVTRLKGKEGDNDFGRRGYGGPCPPGGAPHRFRFRAYALDAMLDVEAGATRDVLADAMRGHVLAWGEVTGTYGRS